MLTMFCVRGKYIMPDPTAQGRRGCCHSMSPGPASSKAEHVFSVGTCTQKTHTHYVYTYIHGWPRGSQTGTQSTHTNIDSTNSLILLPSLAEQDGSPLMRIHIHMYKVDPCSSWSQALSLLSSWPLDSSLLSCWHLDIQALKAAALLQLLVQTMQTNSWPGLSRSLGQSLLPPPPVFSPLEIHRCSHTQSWPLETHSPPCSQATWSLLAITCLLAHLHSLQLLAPWTHRPSDL